MNMILKSMKSKIAAGVIVVSVVAGTSTVFAGVDARAQFNSWYQSLLSTTSTHITSDAVNKYNDKLNDYSTRNRDGYKELKSDSINAINQAGGVKTSSVQNAVIGQKNAYKADIDRALVDITKSSDSDFAKIVSDANGQVDTLNTQAVTDKKADLQTALNTAGDNAVKNLNQQVSGTTTLSKVDLQAKVTTAQAQVNGLIFLKTLAANKDVADHIQDQINALTKQLNDYAAQLVQENKDKINAAGDQAQADALAALDQIVLSVK